MIVRNKDLVKNLLIEIGIISRKNFVLFKDIQDKQRLISE